MYVILGLIVDSIGLAEAMNTRKVLINHWQRALTQVAQGRYSVHKISLLQASDLHKREVTRELKLELRYFLYLIPVLRKLRTCPFAPLTFQ